MAWVYHDMGIRGIKVQIEDGNSNRAPLMPLIECVNIVRCKLMTNLKTDLTSHSESLHSRI